MREINSIEIISLKRVLLDAENVGRSTFYKYTAGYMNIY